MTNTVLSAMVVKVAVTSNASENPASELTSKLSALISTSVPTIAKMMGSALAGSSIPNKISITKKARWFTFLRMIKMSLSCPGYSCNA